MNHGHLTGLVLAVFLAGCTSPKREMYKDAHEITELATEITEISIVPEVIERAEKIVDLGEDVKKGTTKVKDIESKWERMLKLVLVIAGVIAAVYFTWVYVVPIRAIVGRFLPRRKAEAYMLRKINRGEMEPREFAARWRADPANEGAYQSVKKKELLRGRSSTK